MHTQKIDVHHHVFPKFYLDELARRGVKTEGGGMAFPEWSIEAALEAMDRAGIAAGIASIASPGVWFGKSDEARRLARSCNEFLADLVNKHPTRFGAFASLPLPDTQAAIAEAIYALEVLHCDGINLLASVADRFLGDPAFDDLMLELDRRRGVVFIHPNVHSTSRLLGLAFPDALFEFIADTTRAVLNLALSGTLERYPNIRWILAHSGGAAPFLAWRLALADHDPRFANRMPQGMTTYLRRFFYDTALSPSPYAMKPVMDLAGPNQIVFGSDFPYATDALVATEVHELDRLEVFDAATRQAMERGNALKLFPRLAVRLAAQKSNRSCAVAVS